MHNLFRPRIYCVPPPLFFSAWLNDTQLRKISDLGFDHLMIAPTGRLIETEPDLHERIAQFLPLCQAHGLRLIMDAAVQIPDSRDAFVESHADMFTRSFGTDNDLPDPRTQNVLPGSKWYGADFSQLEDLRSTVLDPSMPEYSNALDYCYARLESWLKIGVHALLCKVDAGLNLDSWRRLVRRVREDYPEAKLFEWVDDIKHLRSPFSQAQRGDGLFDALFAPECRFGDVGLLGRKYLQELAQYRTLAPGTAVIGMPDNPFGRRLAQANADAAGPASSVTNAQRFQRALQVAVAISDGVMIPAGFEYGIEDEISAHFSAEALTKLFASPLFDLTPLIKDINAGIASCGLHAQTSPELISTPHAPVALLRQVFNDDAGEQIVHLTAINLDAPEPRILKKSALRQALQDQRIQQQIWPLPTTLTVKPGPLAFGDDADDSDDAHAGQATVLHASEVRIYRLQTLPLVTSRGKSTKREVDTAARQPRVVVDAVTPQVDGNRFPVKAVVGNCIAIEADIFTDGHDKLSASVLWRTADEDQWSDIPMKPLSNDRWQAYLPLERVGKYVFSVEGWRDTFATYRDELKKKSLAGLDVSLELEEGRLLIVNTLMHHSDILDSAVALELNALAEKLKLTSPKKTPTQNSQRIALLLSPVTALLMKRAAKRDFAHRSAPQVIDSERKAVEFASWYEIFPRSQSGDATRHGNFDDVIARLPAIEAMGFDTLYFPPIDPIGSINRKGRNNTLTPANDDPGSPYAIGSKDGGHTDIEPELGTLEDFQRLRLAAAEHGIELALDFAIQCAPDHPWLKEHPGWFDWRPDGSIRYAENPPKKCQDIVNVDFYADGAIPDLWSALRDVVVFWIKQDIRIFRVDNPHTKPLPFWEWMIADIRRRHPDVIFLAEAFTRPKFMYRLAKVGFSQSYTYFAWCNTKAELTEYMTELAKGPSRDFFRPHFFVNTPDITPFFLPQRGRAEYLIRAALAATLSGLWSVYSGFERCEAQAIPSKEEYLHSEKYETRAWDWDSPSDIVSEITRLNQIRRSNPALHTHLNVDFLAAQNDNILYFSKAMLDDGKFGDNVLLIAINVDPHFAQSANIELPLWRFGLPEDANVNVTDLMHESSFTWSGKWQHIHLDPADLPFAIWRIRPVSDRRKEYHA